ncbi:MAG: hypothetical protein ACOYI5_00315 [Christensenellales bacterium]
MLDSRTVFTSPLGSFSFTPALLAGVFRVKAEVAELENGQPYIIYHGSV